MFVLLSVVPMLAGLFWGAPLIATWWSRPFAAISQNGGFSFSRISPDVYDFSGTVLTAYTLFAFALGTAAGAVIRRTVPAMAVSMAGFLALRIPMEAIRGHLLPPLTRTVPGQPGIPSTGRGDWVLSSTPVDPAGRPVPISCQGSGSALSAIPCHAVGRVSGTRIVYQPLSRFWPLQGIETDIVAGIAITLLATAAWWAIRKIS